MKLRYTERAKNYLKSSIKWYEKQKQEMGLYFLDSVEKAIVSIIENPEKYRFFYSQFRGCVIKKFPFIIYYSIEKTEIVIHSVFNCRRSPTKRP